MALAGTRHGRGLGAVLIGLLVLTGLALGVALPLGRPVAVDGAVDAAAAEEAVMLADLHQDHPITQWLTMSYDVRPFDPAEDRLPPTCDGAAEADGAFVVTGRGFWLVPVTRTLVGCGGMSTM